ncbi:MAG: glycosyltransferase [Calditrichaceae bacterium]|nr:glycosyltransferase [Calditrichaceae bacterium]MBN2710347.1 glycosyltransferase [Calditrichaceae bacterium]RQV95097.1 MAG: glycosyltransferase [Calditrichota bacterium]
MKFSIITVCHNAVSTIERTIKSVIGQNYPDFEYIVIDGASTDGTLNILDDYRQKITHLISEKDRGIYSAMNKGIRLANGEIIAFLNSDDFYIDENVLTTVRNRIETSDKHADVYYGNLIIYNKGTGEGRLWKPGLLDRLFLYRGTLPHPAMFYRRNVFDTVGIFDESFVISGDYEWVTRAYFHKQVKFSYINVLPVVFMEGGKSTSPSGSAIAKEEKIKIRNMYYSDFSGKIYYPIRNRIKKTFGF